MKTSGIRQHRHGGPEELLWEEYDLPALGQGQVLLRHTAIGLNFIDVYQRTGLYPQAMPFEGDLAGQFARQHDLGRAVEVRHEAGLLQCKQIDLVDGELLEVRQPDLGRQPRRQRLEAALRQPPLQRHLATFETDLVEAARTRLLALVATTRGLPEARADAAADAALGVLGAFGRLDGVQFHGRLSMIL